jgi:hypothetical protein
LKYLRYISLSLVLLLWQLPAVLAQCTQCKSAAAAKDEAGNLYVGAGLNFGILYLLFLPFLCILAIGGYWFYRNYRLRQEG